MSLFNVTPQLALCPGFQLELWESEEAGFVPETKHNCAFFVGKGRDKFTRSLLRAILSCQISMQMPNPGPSAFC